jgi:hypothetical protein
MFLLLLLLLLFHILPMSNHALLLSMLFTLLLSLKCHYQDQQLLEEDLAFEGCVIPSLAQIIDLTHLGV